MKYTTRKTPSTDDAGKKVNVQREKSGKSSGPRTRILLFLKYYSLSPYLFIYFYKDKCFT